MTSFQGAERRLAMRKLKAVPNSNPAVESLTGQIRGFATDKRMKDALLNYGLSDKHIYMLGSGAEDLDACLRSFRGRAGCLVLAEDLQAFGPTKREVSDRADALEKADIRVVDLSHPEDQSYAALVRRAHNFISRNHFVGDRVKARERGAQGGTAKGALAWNRREEIAPKWLIDRIVNHGQIPWDTKIDLLAPYFSKATLRRHYGIKPTMGRRERDGAA